MRRIRSSSIAFGGLGALRQLFVTGGDTWYLRLRIFVRDLPRVRSARAAPEQSWSADQPLLSMIFRTGRPGAPSRAPASARVLDLSPAAVCYGESPTRK